MPSKRRPQARRAGQPRAGKTKSTDVSVVRSARTGKPKRVASARASLQKAPFSQSHRAPRPSSLSASQLRRRANALAAHADMLRDPDLRASQAAKDQGIKVRDLWTYIPKAFKKDTRGRICAIPDRYVRRMEIPGPDGPIVIKIRGSKARSEVARFRNDVFDFLGGDVS